MTTTEVSFLESILEKMVSYMFMYTSKFNQDIGSGDVLNVTNMYNMFSEVENFNQSLSQWDVSKVTKMRQIFDFTNLSSTNY